MKRVLAMVTVVLMALTMFGCTGNASQGNPQARQAAYDAASAQSKLMILAASGNADDSKVSVEFIDAWETDDTNYEIYQVAEDVDGLDWHDTWLLGVASIDGGTWKKVAEWEPVEAGHKYPQSDIDAFKTLCEFNANEIDYDAIDGKVQSEGGDAAQNESQGEATAIALDGNTIFKNADNGMTLTMSELPKQTDGTMGYAVSFDDGNVFTVVYDHMEMDNAGEQEDVYLDDGFGIALHYAPAFPKVVTILGNSAGAQEYAGVYMAD